MSWPGENDPPSGGGGGRGRRRRADSPPEDPYQTAQSQGPNAGRHGSGEYERPAEYVARAEQEAAAYDQYGGYADPAYQQPQYQQDPYQQGAYQQGAYQQGGYQQYQAQDSYQAQDPYPAQDPYQPQDPYQTQSYGYGSAYPEAPAQYQNLDSSGFYQPTYQGSQAPPVPQAPQAPQTPSYEQFPQQPAYEDPSVQRVSAFPTMPEPVAGFVPDPEPILTPAPARAAAAEPEFETRTESDDTGEPEGELNNWLQFVGSDDRRVERARRRRVQLISLAAALVLLVGGGAWVLFSGGGGVKATETTVLFQVKDPNGNAVGNVVLVADKNEVAGKSDAAGRGAAVLIPSELSVESAALDSQPFGGAMPNTAPAGKDALTTLLGVNVDGVWSMDGLTFAALLNNLIGVTVTVDPASAAAVLDPSGKPLFQAGPQDMTGDKAAYYATYKPKGESPDKQLARFGQVVQAMLAKIPHQASTTTAVLNSLAAVPDPALPNDKLAAILTALGTEEQGGRFSEQPLPVRSDGTGVMDLDKASAVVKNLLDGASKAKDNGGLTRVSVADGTGRMDTVSSRAMAESKLVGGGYTPVDQGVTAQTPSTYVMVPSQGATSLGDQVALALGLPDSAVRVTPFDTTLTDARVVLGADWTQLGQVPADQPTTPDSPADSGAGTASAPGDTSATGGGPTDGTKGSTGPATHRPTSTGSSAG
ncbi:hypothetical protein ABH926_008008 [Catenulispora sp. GP43]|uniref:LCP family protein n=1 Tax=Catenulispora sp. GP43 TaxID=3156263 RepID=UPI00351982B9